MYAIKNDDKVCMWELVEDGDGWRFVDLGSGKILEWVFESKEIALERLKEAEKEGYISYYFIGETGYNKKVWDFWKNVFKRAELEDKFEGIGKKDKKN